MNWNFTDDGLFFCGGCDDDTPEPQAPRRDNTLCVRCARAERQARRYRITVPRRNAIMRFQRDVCALCQEGPPTGHSPDAVTFWHIDHDHHCCPPGRSCGRCVRGLLCLPCNAIRLPAHERLPDVLRDSPRFNTYLHSPPTRHPEAPLQPRTMQARDASSSLIDAFLTAADHPAENTLGP